MAYKESRRQLEVPDPDNIYNTIEDSLDGLAFLPYTQIVNLIWLS